MDLNGENIKKIRGLILFTAVLVVCLWKYDVVFSVLNEWTGWTYWPCYLIALVVSVLWNFTLNRRYTFQSANNVPVAMAKVFAFYCVFTPVSTIVGNYLAESLLWNEYLVTAVNMVANFTLEFLYDRFFVFRDSLDTNDRAKKQHADEQ